MSPLVSVLRLSGVIGGGRRGLSLETLEGHIAEAFAPSGLAAVALSINSPGGSPVQSALIARRIRALAAEKSVPVLAFVEDVAASGGYWLACAADEITAHGCSIIGSIGVVSAGFGFTGLIEKLGVDRRVHTSGASKSMLDPFQVEKPAEVAHLQSLQAEMHEAFKQWIRERRGGRLAAPEAELFDGAFWAGQQSLTLGLIDRLGDMRSTLRERFGENVIIRLVNPPRGPGLGRLIGLDAGSITDGVIDSLSERAIFARFGM
ncbi:S49 family peptidase [Niveispirillum lacus]|uniref:S49 family peptidase n=1 Tax=Niveispirillum lacus TaxID=1981099 RepID=UPI001FE5BAAE|nr:S49 family peptidase [Niveispirillum lacus]